MNGPTSPEQSGEGLVIVRGDADGFAQDITAGAHHLRSDEPASAGGTNTGPTPYDLLLAALGSCTSMTRCDMRATEAVAAPACHRPAAPFQSSRRRLCGVRDAGHEAHGHRSGGRARWIARRGSARAIAGHRQPLPGSRDAQFTIRYPDAADMSQGCRRSHAVV